jgi:signal transduction histidine kinase
MTIRQSLLITFLMFSVSFATLMTALAYHRSRAALSTEIRQSLEIQALTLTQQIEATLFERIKDLQGWRSLDLMQDVKVGDVDKRLSRFLSDIKTAYSGMYREILCVAEGRVVSASNAALIGQPARQAAAWVRLDIADGAVMLARPDALGSTPEMVISSDLEDAFSDHILGQIYAYFNWSEIVDLLDRATTNSGRHALLLDAERRPLAISSGLRERVTEADTTLDDWPVEDAAHGVFEFSDRTFQLADLLVGYAHAAGYRGLPNLGWSVVVLTPVRTALASVRELLLALIVLLVGSVLIAAVLATRLSARTARPIQELTAYARTIGAQMDAPPRLISGSREVEALNLAFNRMIEDLKQSRDRLVRVSKLAAVGEMAAKLAHEVRTPLGIIRSSAELLDRQAGLDPRGHEMLNFMINECDRINQLVTGLLESARPRQPVRELRNINTIIAHVAEMLSEKLRQKDLMLELPAKDAEIIVACDRDQMIQILLNLLMNAIQILAPGGRIRVSSRIVGDEFELEVEDDGPGVPADNREAILEPLVSNRSGGIGLGLSIVREIVNMHFGTLQVADSDLGGACFCVRLPLGAEENPDAAP